MRATAWNFCYACVNVPRCSGFTRFHKPAVVLRSSRREGWLGARNMDDIPVAIDARKPRFLDKLRFAMRERNMAYSTEKTYIRWIRLFIRFHNKRHPKGMGAPEVDAFLSWLAVERNVAPATQAIALNALVFLYHKFLGTELGDLQFARPKPRRSVPQVLAHREALAVIHGLRLPFRLMAALMYGSGLRLMECCRLRIKDIDFGMSEIVVRNGKGNKDRRTMLPQSLTVALEHQAMVAGRLHRYDLQRGFG